MCERNSPEGGRVAEANIILLARARNHFPVRVALWGQRCCRGDWVMITSPSGHTENKALAEEILKKKCDLILEDPRKRRTEIDTPPKGHRGPPRFANWHALLCFWVIR